MQIRNFVFAIVLGGATLLTSACGTSNTESAQAANPEAAPTETAGTEKGLVPGGEGTQSNSMPFAKRDSATSGRQLESAPVSIPAGTTIAVRINQTVSSASATAGQSFEASLAEPLVVNGQTIAPRGANAIGTVTDARSSGRLKDSGYLRLTLSEVEINGKMTPVRTSTVFKSGGKYAKRNTAIIGGSAAGGALIGGLMGGGKGALIGAGVGAAGGTAGAAATGKKDVSFPVESRLSFRLTEAVNVR